MRSPDTQGAAGTDTRRRILRAALELFSTSGYAGTSIRAIAENLDITKAALYYHFASKEQILAAVTEPIQAEMGLLLQAAISPPLSTAEQLLTQLVDMLSRHALLIRTMITDPSSVRRNQHGAPTEMIRAITAVLAGDGGPDGLLRARCAVGAALSGVLGTIGNDPRSREPLKWDQAPRLVDGDEHTLDASVRGDVVSAALRALGER